MIIKQRGTLSATVYTGKNEEEVYAFLGKALGSVLAEDGNEWGTSIEVYVKPDSKEPTPTQWLNVGEYVVFDGETYEVYSAKEFHEKFEVVIRA